MTEKILTCPHCKGRDDYQLDGGGESTFHCCTTCARVFSEHQRVSPNTTDRIVGTPDDNDKYHDVLLDAALKQVSITIKMTPETDECDIDFAATKAALKNLNALMVNMASLMWVKGMVSELDRIKVVALDPDQQIVQLVGAIDESLEAYVKQQDTLADNLLECYKACGLKP